ncbi:chymotrypsin-1-like isoform X4 [Diachasmimorpha longicaudata]|uniref:chymotrypsin-1-like isoform X4 n=1 Tax=Diachasmimorpha longicaudata TaxID=58733 RepID=UPI0030B8E04B
MNPTANRRHFVLWMWVCLILTENFQCGDAIHFGKIALEGQFKYMAAIFNNGNHVCGGAVIDGRHILTAAHCVAHAKARAMAVITGAADWRSSRRQYSNVKNIHIHEEYMPLQNAKWKFVEYLQLEPRRWQDLVTKHDIAVLTLTEALPLGENIIAVMLPRKDSLPYCDTISVAGWGRRENDETDSILRFSNLAVVSPQLSKRLDLASSKDQFDIMDFSRTSKMDVGDSGSPFVRNNIIYGVLSTGSEADLGNSVVVTQVYSYLDFIENAVHATYENDGK